jgi:hypothetical protein
MDDTLAPKVLGDQRLNETLDLKSFAQRERWALPVGIKISALWRTIIETG